MGNKQILIVDDMPDARTLLRILLSHKGNYTVLEATNGEEALSQAAQHRPDLILLDYMMPDIDGIEVCRQLRGALALAEIPVLMLTARSDLTIRKQSLSAGATGFMTKPIKPMELLETVKNLLDAHAGTPAADTTSV